MKIAAIIFALAFIGWGAYWQGHRAGVASAPEMVLEQRTHNAEIEAILSDHVESPTSQEQMCERIMGIVLEEIGSPAYLAGQ